MRYQGRITTWKDDQGFGFITPNGGSETVFVHIKKFSNRQRRPLGSELVTYEVIFDERRRTQAINVAFVGERREEWQPYRPGWAASALGIVLLVFIGRAAIVGRLSFWVLGVYVAASVITFIAYAFDKEAAKKGHWRTKEATLQLFSLLGGWPGALLAQKILRHKWKKQEFQTVFWATVLVNCAGLLVYSSPAAMYTLSEILYALRGR